MVEQGEESPGTARRRPVWLRAASGGAVALAVVVAAIVAGRADGRPVHDVDLTDGGIWVSGGRSGSWGRLNTGAHQLDLIVRGAGRSGEGEGVLRPDVLQDGRIAVGVTADRRLVGIDTSTGEPMPGSPVQVPEPHWVTGDEFHRPDLVALGGGTLAVVDHDSGRIWATRLDPGGDTAVADLRDSGELDTVGPQAAITVTGDGDVMAVSAKSGRVVEIPAEGEGFGHPERTDLGFSGRVADITAVGDDWVVLDAETGEIHAERLSEPQPVAGSSAEVAGQDLTVAALQQPGPASDVVAYQSLERAGYVSITDGGRSDGGEGGVVSGIDGTGEGSLAEFIHVSRPVLNGDCLYAAWGRANTILWGRACGGEEQPTAQLPLESSLTRRNGVAVRHSRGQLVLNDLDSGRVFDLGLPGDLRVDSWPDGAPRGDLERYDPSLWGERPATSTSSPTTTTR